MSTPYASAQPEAVAPQEVRYEPLCEKRFAVVIYGGVSLAIYINGIVQEMLALVRATAPATISAGETEPLLSSAPTVSPERRLTGSERVYRKLGQLLGPNGTRDLTTDWQRLNDGHALPVRTRFVIDVLSGTSAGGINAMFLAKALATNAPLKPLQTLWQREGDIARLINDKHSLEGPLRGQNPPQSMLNSQRMYLKLLAALDGMDAEGTAATAASPLVDALDLFSTTTDIAGLVVPITLADKVVKERRHRNVFHFRHAPKGPSPKGDFVPSNNPFLAYAARCTSAFPFAFEPMALCDIFPVLRSSDVHASQRYCDPDTNQWQQFYLDYLGDPRMGLRHEAFQLRPFGDGGYLDNKPFSYAIETLLSRHADLPVERKLVYIEPSPEKLKGDTFERGRPDALENSVAALLTLPRYETIREDLEVVVKRNFEVERINRVVADVLGSINAGESGTDAAAWLREGSAQWGGGYITYEKLKLSTVTDDLADLLSREFAIDAHSALGEGVRIIASQWRELRYPSEEQKRQFLLQFDVSYRLRRFRHLWNRINGLHAAVTGSPEFVEQYRAELRRIKGQLEEPYLLLKDLLERSALPKQMTSGVLLQQDEMMLVLQPPTRTELDEKWRGLERYLAYRDASGDGAKARAKYLLIERRRLDPLTTLANALGDEFKTRMVGASDVAKAAFAQAPNLTRAANQARQQVELAYRDFEKYDSAIFPITYGTNVGECERIDVHRISPEDAKATNARFDGLARVRGEALAAFGAFLDADWRTNDILLGRFHGAERLVEALLPGRDKATADIRAALIEEAHKEIACDFLELTARGLEQRWTAETKRFFSSVPDSPNPTLVAQSATRASAVTGALLEGISDTRRLPTRKGFAYVALLSRFLFQFVEISVPHTLGELFGKYWLQLLALFALMLDVIAIFQPAEEVRKLAAILSLAVVVLFGARQLLRRYLRGQLLISPAVTMLLTALVVLTVTAVGFLLPAIWAQLDRTIVSAASAAGALVVDAWQSRPTASSGVYTGTRFGWAFLVAAAAIWAISATVLWNVRRGIPMARSDDGRPLDPMMAIQKAKTREDVIKAVGMYDLDRRVGLESAMRADFGFAAAYGLFFTAAGVLLAIYGMPAGLIVGGVGVGAALADMRENQAVLAALAAIPTWESPYTESLAPAPYRFSRVKWALFGAASLLTMGFAFYTILRYLRTV